MRARAARAGRRGGALLLVLFATVALGAVAAAAVALKQGTELVSAYQERERDFRYAAEMGLAVGRARVERDTTFVLPDSGWRKVLDSVTVTDADNAVIPRTRVTVYAGKSGITTGQFGQFVTLVAVADDGNSTRYVRRLELAAENFARFAMFTNTWVPSNLCYGTGEYIRGLGWSNQHWNSCGSPTYGDTIGAVNAISGGTPTWIKGPGSIRPNQRPIPMPTVARLAFMPGYANAATLSFTPVANRPMRLEFEAIDVDQNGDSAGTGEGFLRVFEGWAEDPEALNRVRLPVWSATADWNALRAVPHLDEQCGDFHGGRFYPAIVHKTHWFRQLFPGVADTASIPNTHPHRRNNIGVLRYRSTTTNADPRNPDNVTVEMTEAEHNRVFNSAQGTRCYPAGAPQLVAVERIPGRPNGRGGTWTEADAHKGGEDTTFTPVGRWGAWRPWTGPADITTHLVTTANKRQNEAGWLFPLGKRWNPGWRGVVHVGGGATAFLSGQLRARVTVYSTGALTFLDDLTYVVPPNTPGQACDDEATNMLGVIAAGNVMVDENALHRPVRVARGTTIPNPVRFMSGGPHFRLHGVLMSLGGTAGVTNFHTGPSIAASACGTASFSGGCINQVGGVIQQAISATYQGANTGFAENREVDRCMLVSSPPYFPTTGRFIMNRYFESDPARFNADALYRALQAY